MRRESPVTTIIMALIIVLVLLAFVYILTSSTDETQELTKPVEMGRYTVYQTQDVSEYRDLLSSIGRESIVDISVSQYAYGTAGPYNLYTVTYENGAMAQEVAIYKVKEFAEVDEYLSFIEEIGSEHIVDIAVVAHAHEYTGPRINYVITYKAA